MKSTLFSMRSNYPFAGDVFNRISEGTIFVRYDSDCDDVCRGRNCKIYKDGLNVYSEKFDLNGFDDGLPFYEASNEDGLKYGVEYYRLVTIPDDAIVFMCNDHKFFSNKFILSEKFKCTKENAQELIYGRKLTDVEKMKKNYASVYKTFVGLNPLHDATEEDIIEIIQNNKWETTVLLHMLQNLKTITNRIYKEAILKKADLLTHSFDYTFLNLFTREELNAFVYQNIHTFLDLEFLKEKIYSPYLIKNVILSHPTYLDRIHYKVASPSLETLKFLFTNYQGFDDNAIVSSINLHIELMELFEQDDLEEMYSKKDLFDLINLITPEYKALRKASNKFCCGKN